MAQPSTPDADLVPPLSALQKARKDIADRVGIAGLKESIEERVKWIRTHFQLVLLFLLCCSAYYSYDTVKKWIQSGFVDEIQDVVDLEQAAVSNVTVCVPIPFNQTAVKELVVITEKVEGMAKEIGYDKERFMHQLLVFLSLTTRSRHVEAALQRVFRLLYESNPIMADYSKFLRSILPKCENVLKRCVLAGKEFDCCQRTEQLIDDDAVCYKMALNYDTISPFPQTLTQTRPGPEDGLAFEVSMDLRDAAFLEDDMANGFKIYVHPSSIQPFMLPMPASSNTETFIKVTASRRLLNEKKCVPVDRPPPLMEGAYYDPYGYTCLADKHQRWAYKHFDCYMPFFHYRPNRSETCTPHMLYFFFESITSDVQKIYRRERAQNAIKQIESEHRAIFNSRPFCLKHCRYWEYATQASFVDLDPSSDQENQTSMFSRVHVFYSDFGYRQHREAPALTSYLAFCEFGNVLVLYLGISMVGVIQAGVYFSRYAWVWWYDRSPRIRFGRSGRVGPA